jgi:hypothetical protein
MRKIVIALLFSGSALFAIWKENGHHNMVWHYFEEGNHFSTGVYIPVNLTSQPNKYSCGAANAYMFVDWAYTIENNFNMHKKVTTNLSPVEAFYLAMDNN